MNLQAPTVEAAGSLREVGDPDLDAAETVVAQGRKLLDGNGWLYLDQAEVATPRPAGILRLSGRGCCTSSTGLTLDGDANETAGVVAAPPLELELAFSQLLERV